MELQDTDAVHDRDQRVVSHIVIWVAVAVAYRVVRMVMSLGMGL
jgi:hypothetical protein